MASWKRLTDADDQKIDVNTDQVCYMMHRSTYTALHFAGGEIQSVKETPDEIHMAPELGPPTEISSI